MTNPTPNTDCNPAVATAASLSLLSAVLGLDPSLARRASSLTTASLSSSMPASRRNSLQSNASLGSTAAADLSDLLTTEALALPPKTPPPVKATEILAGSGTCSIPLPGMSRQQPRNVVSAHSSTSAHNANKQPSSHKTAASLQSSFKTANQRKASSKSKAVKNNAAANNTTNKQQAKQQVDELWNFIRQEAIKQVVSGSATSANSQMAAVVANNSNNPTMPPPQQQQLQLDEETLRGITQRPSGAWQAQIYYAGKTRYIGCFDSKMIAAQVYQELRERLKKKRYVAKKRPATPALSRSSSSSSLPPFKKRKSMEGSDSGATNGPFEGNNAAAAVSNNDNTYHPSASAAVPATSNNTQRSAAMASAAIGQPCPPSSYNGPNYAPLAPPPPMQSQMNPPQHPQHLPSMQQQWMQMMPPPPPPLHQPQYQYHNGYPFAQQASAIHPNNSVAFASQPYSNLEAYHKATSNKAAHARKSKSHNSSLPKPKKSSATAANKNPEDEKKWKEVRKGVLEIVKKSPGSTHSPAIAMDKDMLRGITMRPSGKFQAQMYFSGQSRYIGVFDTKEQAARAYEMIREKIKPPQAIVVDHHRVLSAMSTPKPKDPASAFAARAAAGTAATGAILPPPINATRAITPSPTTVGDRHGHGLAGTPPYLKGVSKVSSSPLASQGVMAIASSQQQQQQQMTPVMHFGLSIGHYVPTAQQK